MASLDSIKAQIARLTKQAQTIEGKAVQKVLALMDKLGVTVDDLPKKRGRKAGAAKVGGPAKYRDPATGKTWTGHGRAPDWIKNVANRDDFLVAKSGASSPVKAAKKVRKAPTKKATRRPAKKAAAKSRKSAAASGSTAS